MTYEEGRITFNEYLDRVIFHKKRNFTVDQFRDFMFSLTTPYEETIAFIKNIKKQYGLKIVAVSNEARELNAYRVQTYKLNGFIDFFVSSCYVHIRKPDARIFTLALDMANVSASEVIYIDDVQMFTDIAMGVGINSICHHDYLSTAKISGQMGLVFRDTISNNHPI